MKILREIGNIYFSQLMLAGVSHLKGRFEILATVLTQSEISCKWVDDYIPKTVSCQSDDHVLKFEDSLISKVLKLIMDILAKRRLIFWDF